MTLRFKVEVEAVKFPEEDDGRLGDPYILPSSSDIYDGIHGILVSNGFDICGVFVEIVEDNKLSAEQSIAERLGNA